MPSLDEGVSSSAAAAASFGAFSRSVRSCGSLRGRFGVFLDMFEWFLVEIK